MNKIEELFKNRFHDKPSTDGLNTEELWAKIGIGLDQKLPVKKEVKSNKKWLLVLLLLIGAIYFYNSTDSLDAKSPNIEVKDSKKNSPDYDDQVVQKYNTNTGSTSPQFLKNSVLQTTNKTIPEVYDFENEAKGDTPITNDSNEHPLTGTSSAKNSFSITQNNLKDRALTYIPKNLKSFNKISYPTIKNENIYPALETTKESLDLIIEESRFSKPLTHIVALNLYPSKTLVYHELPALLTKLPPEQLKTSSKKPRIGFGLYSGLNTVSTHYKKPENTANIIAELTKATSKNIGSFTSFEISYKWKDNFNFSTGINYESVESTFEYTSQKGTTFVDENRLIDYEIDQLTGDTINPVFGAVTLDAIEVRSVVHRNQFKTIAIPVSFVASKQFGKLGMGVNLGFSYSFYLSQKGKTLDSEGSIFAFDNKIDETVPFKKSFIAFHINPFIDLKIQARLKFRVNPIIKYQAQGTSKLYNLKQNSILMGLNAGIFFTP